ncbi:hypothetical protein AB0M28_13590 [Streptomyces sp. NPDC051940]|uniref:hypothetical protein n=1 Tax=Streptomyces sp. NPDC051940 TaxID=3155675 RepID=UPI00342608D7
MTTDTTAAHLATIINRWGDLHDALTTHTSAPWPPAGRMSDYLAQLDAADREIVRQKRAQDRAAERSPDQIGETSPPLNIDTLDTMRAVEAALVHLADAIASAIQRGPAREIRAAGPLDEAGVKLHMATLLDARDRRRWSLTAPTYRRAPYAAAWLLARVEDAPGPFRTLTAVQRDHIASVARAATRRVEQALGMAVHRAKVGEPCPKCRGQLRVEGGDGTAPAVKCRGCGATWCERESAA